MNVVGDEKDDCILDGSKLNHGYAFSSLVKQLTVIMVLEL